MRGPRRRRKEREIWYIERECGYYACRNDAFSHETGIKTIAVSRVAEMQKWPGRARKPQDLVICARDGCSNTFLPETRRHIH